jgi:transcriptional regulator of arginine metabolism
MSKLARQSAILDLVKQGALASQDELRRRLSRHGFKVTQATLSRDIHELGLVKSSQGYAPPQAAEQAADLMVPGLQRLVREFVLDVRQAQNLLVVRTTQGSAQPVAVAMDSEGWPDAVGTVAGDDTILIVAPDKKSATRLADRIREMLF